MEKKIVFPNNMPPNLDALDMDQGCVMIEYYKETGGIDTCEEVSSPDCHGNCIFAEEVFDFDVLAKYAIDNGIMTKEHLLDIRLKYKL